MKNILLLTVVGLGMLVSSCSKTIDDDIINPPAAENVVTVSADITTNTTWSADKIYFLKGNVFVTSNATLTIEAGTLIKGDKSTKGALIITRGAKINAVGTVDKPIVFTSNVAAGGRSQGDWGGVILLGKAPNNQGESVAIEGISDATDKGKYGGTDANDNSGTMKYVRIEYAGIALSPDNEINGLTFGSVGAGTTIDYIEVYRSGDDAYEWFGGTVNCKHLLAIDTFDDDFDTDFGFSGKVQFGLAQRLAATADASGSNGFESDNNGAGDAKTPQTSAVFSNMTILGPREANPQPSGVSINANFQHAAQIRRNSSISILNSVFAGYVQGVFYDDALPTTGTANSSNNLLSGSSVFANNIIYGTGSNNIKASNATALGSITTLINASTNLLNDALYANAVYTDPYKFSADIAGGTRAGTPNFTQIAASPALTGAAYTNAKVTDAFFDKTGTFRGAFGTSDWSAGWASYNPQVLAYDKPGAVK
ncbi:hypothetical protein ACFQZS_14385 [Mucilaginibacter calamicampi]|uniref:T9SS C-terminal target domain-containing protein n=1 Tax=Mucilaginibacter calamicampi TaxID=1302352 RepID=A0ABW2YZY1_9SPHI